MTIDKIRYYMGEHLYNFWAGVSDLKKIRQAAADLSAEIDAGIMGTIAHHAELELLCYKAGITVPPRKYLLIDNGHLRGEIYADNQEQARELFAQRNLHGDTITPAAAYKSNF